MKTVCYFITRNIYQNIRPSLNSILANGNIDQVYILAEDDDIGLELPENVTVKNITEYKELLNPYGPNYCSRWTYIILLKLALCKIFPDMDKILCMDVDTIIVGDISSLWDLPMENLYLYGVIEPRLTKFYKYYYVNAGVVLWNLKKLRDGTADIMLEDVNKTEYECPEQDCLNNVCRGHIGLLDGSYNYGVYTTAPRSPVKIIHFIGFGQKKFMRSGMVKEWNYGFPNKRRVRRAL